MNKSLISRRSGLCKQRLSELSSNSSLRLRADELYPIALSIRGGLAELLRFICSHLQVKEEKLVAMADVHSKETRSYNMSKIRGKDTAPEMLVRKFLFSKGLRYRLHEKSLPGKPDIVLKRRRIVLFVHGCFWHGHHGCKYYVTPKTKTKWWTAKILSNRNRDRINKKKLRANGWKVIEIFECELKKEKRDKTLNEIYSQIY